MFNIKVINLFCTNSLSKIGLRDYRRDPGKYRVVSFEKSIQKRLKNKIYLLVVTAAPSLRTIIRKEPGWKPDFYLSTAQKGEKLPFSLIHFRFKCSLPLPTRTWSCFFDLCIRNIKSEKLNKNCLTGINPLMSEGYGAEWRVMDFWSTKAILW